MKCHHTQHRSPLKAKNIYVFIWYNLHRLLQWACSKERPSVPDSQQPRRLFAVIGHLCSPPTPVTRPCCLSLPQGSTRLYPPCSLC